MLELKYVPWSELRQGRRVRFLSHDSEGSKTGTIYVQGREGEYLQVMRDDQVKGGGIDGAWNIYREEPTSSLEFLDEAPRPIVKPIEEVERTYADEESINSARSSTCCFCGRSVSDVGKFFCSTRQGTGSDERDICLGCAKYAVSLLEGKVKPSLSSRKGIATKSSPLSVVRHLIP